MNERWDRLCACSLSVEPGFLVSCKAIVGDIQEPANFLSQLGGQDMIVLIAMPQVIPGRVSPGQFAILRRQLSAFFANSIATAKRHGIPLVLTSGASFHTQGTQVADETWAIDRSFIRSFKAVPDG